MKKLSKQQLKLRNELSIRLSSAWDDLQSVADLEEGKVRDDAAVIAAIRAYNEVVDDANSFREMIAGDIQEYFDDRSEAWQQGEKGEAYSSWIEQWENGFPEIDLDSEAGKELQYFDWSNLDNVQEMLDELPEEVDA